MRTEVVLLRSSTSCSVLSDEASALNQESRYNERGIAEGLLASCDIFDPLAGTWIEDLQNAEAYASRNLKHQSQSRMELRHLLERDGAMAVHHCRARPTSRVPF